MYSQGHEKQGNTKKMSRTRGDLEDMMIKYNVIPWILEQH